MLTCKNLRKGHVIRFKKTRGLTKILHIKDGLYLVEDANTYYPPALFEEVKISDMDDWEKYICGDHRLNIRPSYNGTVDEFWFGDHKCLCIVREDDGSYGLQWIDFFTGSLEQVVKHNVHYLHEIQDFFYYDAYKEQRHLPIRWD